MATAMLMGAFYLSVFAPRGLRAAEYDALRRTLDGAGFRAKLGRAVRGVFRRYPSLNKAKIRITR
jgi:hypothetical protein